MNKQEIYELLKNRGIWHESMEHEAVYNMEELAAINNPYAYADAKNLFVRDDKKRNYYLITVKGDKRVDLRAFKDEHGLRKLSFASEEDLERIMGLKQGSVSPFGLLNDGDLFVTFYLDKEFTEGDGLIGVHPNENTATVVLKANDLIRLIKEHGTEVNIVSV